MEIFIQASQFLLSLSILIVLHELGHFIPAKLFKTRVEKFYLFFDPWFSLFKFKKGETEYGIGWLPLGGYVKIAGMIDESMDKEQLAKPAEPWEFRAKPTWQRLIIMLGGVTINFILGFFIYAMVFWSWGKELLPVESNPFGLHFHEQLHEMGFEDGDNIIKINDVKIKYTNEASRAIFGEDINSITVDRGGEEMTFQFPVELGQTMLDSNIKNPFIIRVPAVIDIVLEDSPAKKAGLLKGDSLVQINDTKSPFFSDLADVISEQKEKEITVGFYRNGSFQEKKIITTESGTIGFRPNKPTELAYFNFEIKEFNLGDALTEGYIDAKDRLSGYISSMKYLFTKSGAKQLGGFISIGKIYSGTWDWERFWLNTAFLSLILAFMNILPIPALDGGHVMFLLYEMIAGKPAPQKFLETAQMVGMILLLSLLLFANGNDLYKLISGFFS